METKSESNDSRTGGQHDVIQTRFRKRPVVIEARKYAGAGNMQPRGGLPDWLWRALETGVVHFTNGSDPLIIETLEGPLTVAPGDWIIQGIMGELYPCKPDIFAATYEPVLSAGLPSAGEQPIADAGRLSPDAESRATTDPQQEEKEQDSAARGRGSATAREPQGSTAMDKPDNSIIEHGKTCEKVPHEHDPRIPHQRLGPNEGWLHAADDDSPYFVDGLRYCGRCHYWIG